MYWFELFGPLASAPLLGAQQKSFLPWLDTRSLPEDISSDGMPAGRIARVALIRAFGSTVIQ
jgi:hypothetical protein